jgi:hypothetical protein
MKYMEMKQMFHVFFNALKMGWYSFMVMKLLSPIL